jgi:hypothetical protein
MDVFLVSLALAALDALEVRPDGRRTALRLPCDLSTDVERTGRRLVLAGAVSAGDAAAARGSKSAGMPTAP